jgi:hypothetical protein
LTVNYLLPASIEHLHGSSVLLTHVRVAVNFDEDAIVEIACSKEAAGGHQALEKLEIGLIEAVAVFHVEQEDVDVDEVINGCAFAGERLALFPS